MKSERAFHWFFPTALCIVLCVVSASAEEDLADFDFADLKEIDWNYDSEHINAELRAAASAVQQSPKQQPITKITFDDFEEENQVRPFDWRENVLKTALSKALTNAPLRQKFLEVMPILRVLSPQQRLALSALISAQINAKGGQQLKLEQVRTMFGDDKQLLLPIVYDIANLVRNSAHKYLQFADYAAPHASSAKLQQQTPIDRRLDELDSAELASDDIEKDVGNIVLQPTSAAPSAARTDDRSLEDFFADMPEDVLDPQSINEELQAAGVKTLPPKMQHDEVSTSNSPATNIPANASRDNIFHTTKTPITNHTLTLTNTLTSNQTLTSPARHKRSTENEFVHKLIRSVPLSINEDDSFGRGLASNALRLNTSGFVVPTDTTTTTTTTPSQTARLLIDAGVADTPLTPTASSTLLATQNYQQIEDLAFASLNGTEVELTDVPAPALEARIEGEPLPSPEELIAGPRYRIAGNKIYGGGRPKHSAVKRKRVQAPRARPKVPPPSRSGAGGQGDYVFPKKCERFTASMCIRTEDYPLDQIMGSIRRHKNAMTALLADYHDKAAGIDLTDDFDDFSFNRRGDDSTGGGMCHSVVRYARPQKARSASGEWKYIVNTGQHTQTLRLEKCTSPQESCSYLAHSYRSHCAQVYNYHRLLSWDKTRGLHVDIFKVPSCCSCQVDGYRQQFPPLAAVKSKGISPAYSADTYSTINEDLDYNDEDDEDDLSFRFSNGFNGKQQKHDTGYDDNELFLASQKVRSTLHAPNPTLGSYLSPPGGEDDDYDKGYAFTHGQRQAPQLQYPQQQQQHQHSYVPQGAAIPTSTPSATSSAKNLLRDLARRRPYKSLNSAAAYNEARVDLDLAPSELQPDNEVKFAGNTHATANKRLPHKRQRIYSVPHTASVSSAANAVAVTVAGDVAAAGVATTTTSASAVATRGGVVGNRGGLTTNAHKTPAARAGSGSSHPRPPTAQHTNAVRSKSRFRASGASASPTLTPATPTTTASHAATSPHQWNVYEQQQQQTPAAAQPPRIPLHQLNTVYHTQYNNNTISSTTTTAADAGNTVGASNMPKRINYSYHPIIDFFENHRYSTAETPAQQQQQQPQQSAKYGGDGGGGGDATAQAYPHKIPKAQTYDVIMSRERRIGYGAGAGTGEGIGGVGGHPAAAAELDFHASDNAWHPVIVEAI